MKLDPSLILKILDGCCQNYSFPMLDNGYVFLAANRLSLFRDASDWALVIEVFGYSPRSGFPAVHVETFASKLHQRDPVGSYVTDEAHRNYLANNPNNDSRVFFPIDEGEWIDEADSELVALSGDFTLRGSTHALPDASSYAAQGVELEQERPQVFEFCRFLASCFRGEVLATEEERRVSVLPGMEQILLLDEWFHPDTASDQLPSDVESFRQLAEVLASGDASFYRPSVESNSHWSNWPEGGRL